MLAGYSLRLSKKALSHFFKSIELEASYTKIKMI